MSPEKAKLGRESFSLSEKDQLSVDILNSIQNANWFRQKGCNVVLYHYNDDRELEPNGPKYPIEDFLNAVDYYYNNRESEQGVNAKMNVLNGEVEIYGSNLNDRTQRKVVAKISNFKVPQILEFAYLLVRKTQKNK